MLQSRLIISLRQRTRAFHCSLPHKTAEQPRVNQLGIQYLSHDLQQKVFPKNPPNAYLKPRQPNLVEIAKAHLKHHDFLGKKTNITEPINIPNLPTLVGSTLDEHFHKIGMRSSEPYLSMAEEYLSGELPPKPTEWLFRSGWTRYAPGKDPEKVPYPLEDTLTFDVETMYKLTHYSCLCTAASSEAWYGWVSPALTQYKKDPSKVDHAHLIPFNLHSRPKLLVGFNVSYDRARIFEEYSIKTTKAFYLDAMALHVATKGICSQQRPTWSSFNKNKISSEAAENESEENADGDDIIASPSDQAQRLMDDPWLLKASPNSLAQVAEFYCGIKLPKDQRSVFASTDIDNVISEFQQSMNYCAGDVYATFQAAKAIFPVFRQKIPHPVSFAALKQLGKTFLPTTQKWPQYIRNAEAVYEENRSKVDKILVGLVEDLVRYIKEDNPSLKPDFENDPWLKQLDWTIKEKRLRRDGTPVARQAYLTGFPEWYRELFKTTVSSNGEKSRELSVTVRTRVTPFLLRLKWEGYPLIWTESCGWCYKVPYDKERIAELEAKNYTKARLSEDDFEKLLPELRDNGLYELFKVPHPEGPAKRTTSVMAKHYLRYFDSGVLSSEFDYAKEILDLNARASYWMSNRARISNQFCVFADPTGNKNRFGETIKQCKEFQGTGLIIPQLCTMGTVTRRATENTWLTASNSKTNRIGSELKAMVEAPKGYVFVGADVDSEELWIASLIGDSKLGIHGGTALGWMCLEGDKAEKTDLHSKTASIMGILRGDAKIFNYGRIYGAGVKFATRLLKQCNGSLSDEEAARIAEKLYEETKGVQAHARALGKRLYMGGTESVMFNVLEAIAHTAEPRTPVLGAALTDALNQRNLNKNNYLTSRVNWTIQSSGVDYLHLLVVSMEYLIEKYKIDARLMITVHDELRFMVKEEDTLVCALLLQISNLWTRAIFCEQVGIMDLPQSCAFFSEVDVDHVLRKEVSLDCVTPSNSEPITHGKSYDIVSLLNSLDAEKVLGNGSRVAGVRKYNYSPRTRVLDELERGSSEKFQEAKLRLQNSTNSTEWKACIRDLNKIVRQRDDIPKLESTTDAKKKKSMRVERTPDISAKGDEALAQVVNDSAKEQKPKKNILPAKKPVGSSTESKTKRVVLKKVNKIAPKASPQEKSHQKVDSKSKSLVKSDASKKEHNVSSKKSGTSTKTKVPLQAAKDKPLSNGSKSNHQGQSQLRTQTKLVKKLVPKSSNTTKPSKVSFKVGSALTAATYVAGDKPRNIAQALLNYIKPQHTASQGTSAPDKKSFATQAARKPTTPATIKRFSGFPSPSPKKVYVSAHDRAPKDKDHNFERPRKQPIVTSERQSPESYAIGRIKVRRR